MKKNIQLESIKKLKGAIDKVPQVNKEIDELFDELLKSVSAPSPNFVAGMQEDIPLSNSDLVVITVEHVLSVAQANQWPLVRHQNAFYIFNGAYWKKVNDDDLKKFVGMAAKQIGIPRLKSNLFSFKESLIKQFYSESYLSPPKADVAVIKINLRNGTIHISDSEQIIKPFNPDDFMLYQLPFAYDPKATCPKYQAYLDRVLPDKEKQVVLAEYLGYCLTKNTTLKLEKSAILYGTGANGKSVFFEIIMKLLGSDNVSNYSLQSLTDATGYNRAMLPGKLLNFASEISDKLNPTMFKMLISGEPIECRMIYGKPFLLENYCRFMFNTNVLPTNTEQTEGFWRRFLIIHFSETIPEEQRDPMLAGYIIEHELAGVFNWVLDGLKRLLKQKKFSHCRAVDEVLKEFKKNSDSVSLFLEDEQYVKSNGPLIALKQLYESYRLYCHSSGYNFCSLNTFSERLRTSHGYKIVRRGQGRFVFITKVV